MWARQQGFSLIELMVVIVVIAILVSVSVVVYVGIEQRAQETSVRHDMKNIAKQVELYRVDIGRYPDIATFTSLGIRVNKQTYGVNPSGATIFYCVNDSGGAFSIVNRVKSRTLLKYSSVTAVVEPYAGATAAPQLCVDSDVPGTTSEMNYVPFTVSGSWQTWVKG